MVRSGDASTFDELWQGRAEARYLHWCPGSPQNQIQLAFRYHWQLFSSILSTYGVSGKSLEVGCGRGSLSAYFAKNGWEVTLLDYSQDVLSKAESAFNEIGIFDAKYDCCDCLDMPYEDNSFDCIFSIGLYEHFDNIKDVAREQIRCLKPGGILFAYIVPDKIATVQSDYDWINTILASEKASDNRLIPKKSVYRSKTSLKDYCEAFSFNDFSILHSSGAYSMPMISHSPDFPFSLLSPKSELLLVDKLRSIVSTNSSKANHTGWLCSEDYGHALLIYGSKK